MIIKKVFRSRSLTKIVNKQQGTAMHNNKINSKKDKNGIATLWINTDIY